MLPAGSTSLASLPSQPPSSGPSLHRDGLSWLRQQAGPRPSAAALPGPACLLPPTHLPVPSLPSVLPCSRNTTSPAHSWNSLASKAAASKSLASKFLPSKVGSSKANRCFDVPGLEGPPIPTCFANRPTSPPPPVGSRVPRTGSWQARSSRRLLAAAFQQAPSSRRLLAAPWLRRFANLPTPGSRPPPNQRPSSTHLHRFASCHAASQIPFQPTASQDPLHRPALTGRTSILFSSVVYF
jgi:hypothetical protein